MTDPQWAGTFLTEQDLAEQLGISRTPVREAFLLLHARGLIELIPQRGARVPRLTGPQIGQLFEFRTMIECHAAHTTMKSGTVPSMAMWSILDQQRALVELEDLESSKDFIRLDRDFHLQLVQAIRNEFTEEAYSTIRTRQLMVGVDALFRTPTRRLDVCQEHQAIVEALEGDDASLACDLITHHLDLTRRVLTEGG